MIVMEAGIFEEAHLGINAYIEIQAAKKEYM